MLTPAAYLAVQVPGESVTVASLRCLRMPPSAPTRHVPHVDIPPYTMGYQGAEMGLAYGLIQ